MTEPSEPESSSPETPESVPARQRWVVRHRRFTAAGLGLVALALVLAVAVSIFVWTGGVDRYIAREVVVALAQYGVRTEIGHLEFSFGVRTAKLRDVKLYNAETGALIATVDRAELVVETPGLYAPSFERQVVLKTLDLTNLQIYATLDEQGRSNFTGLHNAPPTAPSRIKFDFNSLVASIDGGTLHVDDRMHEIVGELG